MPVVRRRLALPSPASHVLTAAALAAGALLAGCGGGGDDSTGGVATPNALSGSVAVGAPITDARLRILDAAGAVVAENIAVAADGTYAAVPLTGPAPWRLEACGYAGPNYLCVQSVASAAGTANLTPLTTAAMLLASGTTPATMMSGATTLTAAAIAAGEAQLRTSLAGVMASAGVSGTLDFVGAALDAGSRTGYDKLLDAVGVRFGTDSTAFVQITPRLGGGNLYLEQGVSQGTLTPASAAASLDLAGLETLFRAMNASIASAAACSAEATGLRRSLAQTAQLSMGGDPAVGRDAVAAALCGFFAGGGEEGEPAHWGSMLLSPTLGRCELGGAAPLCSVSFVLRDTEGTVRPVGSGMAVTQEAGAWKFVGDLLPIEIRAGAKAQRTKRVDTPVPVYDYNRALAFEVAALPGLQCARVSQRTAAGATTTIGFYKRHPGAMGQERLSLWTPDGYGPNASLDPLVGTTRSADDSWIFLPEGAAGDAVIRNFYRGGRSVTVALFADTACATPFALGGRSEFDVEVEGVPPVWAQLQSMPWPEIDAASATALTTLSIDAMATGSLHATWTFPSGPLGLDGATVCGDRAACGQGGSGRLGEADLRPTARESTVALRNRGEAVPAGAQKMLALYGRNGDGVALQSNYQSCTSVPAGEICR